VTGGRTADVGLSAEAVTVRFGGLVALDGVSIDVPLGRITGLIGPNGAGKTTFFNVCCGFQPCAEGTVRLAGADITTTTPAHRARLGLGRTFQQLKVFTSMTVRENIAFAAECADIDANPLTQLGLARAGRATRRRVRTAAADLVALTGLDDVADVPAGRIPTGRGRVLELARTLARGPQVLLLDEPSSGLDPKESAALGDLVVRITQERGLGVLLVEHDMDLVLSVCHRIEVLNFGRMLMSGTAEEVWGSQAVQDAYLGAPQPA